MKPRAVNNKRFCFEMRKVEYKKHKKSFQKEKLIHDKHLCEIALRYSSESDDIVFLEKSKRMNDETIIYQIHLIRTISSVNSIKYKRKICLSSR